MCPCSARCHREQVAVLAAASQRRIYEPGEPIFNQGDVPEFLYVRGERRRGRGAAGAGRGDHPRELRGGLLLRRARGVRQPAPHGERPRHLGDDPALPAARRGGLPRRPPSRRGAPFHGRDHPAAARRRRAALAPADPQRERPRGGAHDRGREGGRRGGALRRLVDLHHLLRRLPLRLDDREHASRSSPTRRIPTRSSSSTSSCRASPRSRRPSS